MIIDINDKYLKRIFETNSNYSEWFGYYNYDTFNKSGNRMLCNRVNFDAREITEKDTADLGWYNIKSGAWNYIDTTDSFNWQQGAMLQWMPGQHNENKVIYNISQNGHFKSIIFDTDTKDKKIIDFPTYCVTPDGRYSIALNYERSYWCRAYHYQSVVNPKYNVRVAEDDGIFKVDLSNNTVERIIAIQDVISLDAIPDFNEAKHWLEHIMLSPNGKRIAFLHRFTYGEGYITRVCVSDIDGGNLQVLKGWKNNTWSHLGWKSNDAFAIYSIERGVISAAYSMQNQKTDKTHLLVGIIKTAKSLIPGSLKKHIRTSKQYYELFEIKDGSFTCTEKYDDPLFDIDGHPSFTRDGAYMITDSYPDKDGKQRLSIMNTSNKKAILMASFAAPLSGTPASCDLHPKYSFNGKYLVVDTAYTGKHRMIVFELNWENIALSLK